MHIWTPLHEVPAESQHGEVATVTRFINQRFERQLFVVKRPNETSVSESSLRILYQGFKQRKTIVSNRLAMLFRKKKCNVGLPVKENRSREAGEHMLDRRMKILS